MRAALKDWLMLPATEPAGRRKVRTNRILRRKLIRCVSHESPLGNPLYREFKHNAGGKSGERKKKAEFRYRKRDGRAAQPPNLDSIIWMTAFCLAITWACQIRATAIRLMEKIQRAIVKPICVSEAGKPNTRRIQAIGAPKHDKVSNQREW